MAPRSIIIIESSPRPKGNSTLLARELAAGAASLGARVETVRLADLNIGPCIACDACQQSLVQECVIDDDMKPLYSRVRSADVIVYATPIYWFTVSGQIKLFMDRCYALTYVGTAPVEEGGVDVPVLENDLKGKKFGVVLTYGDVDPFVSGAVNALRTFQDMARFLGAELVGQVYGSAVAEGEIAGNSELMRQAYQLGRDLATTA